MQREGESQRAWDVAGFGENSADVIATLKCLPRRDEKAAVDALVTRPGGQVATAMVGCARLGLRARYVGTFGDDAHGTRLRAGLDAEGVDTGACRIVAGPSRSAVILVETATGTRTVLAHRTSALDWPPDELPLTALTSARALLLDATDVNAAVTAGAAAQTAGVMTVVDVDDDTPGLDRLLRVSNVIVVSEAFAGDLRRLHRESGARMVITTLGPHGALAWDGWREYFSPGFVVPVVDTTGAGDAFRAGLIAACLRGPWTLDRGPWTPVLDWANATAALNCRACGAQTGLPTAAEVDALVTSLPANRSKGAWGRRHMASQRNVSEPGDGA